MINLPQKFKKPVVSKKLAAIIFFAILILAGFGFAEKTLAYATSGNWTSTNLLSGKTVSSINSFVYNLSSLPANTTSTVQFSNDNSNWRDSSGNSGQWDTMSQGSHSIDLSALGWITANFYYRVQFTSDGTNTPVLDDIKVKYYDSAGLVIDSSGRVGIGTTAPASVLQVQGSLIHSTNFPYNVRVDSTEAMAAGVGGGIAFGGNYTGTTKEVFGAIQGIKENATDNNYAGALRLLTRAHLDIFNERMRITSSGNVGIGTAAPSYVLDVKARSSVGSATFTGTGLNDMTSGGTFTGATALNYKVEIDATNTPDTFKWSDDGGTTWDATGVAITGSAQTLNNGVTVTFGATTGHTLGDYWTFSTTVTNPLAIQNAAGTRSLYVGNDGNVGIGTTDTGAPLHVYTNLTNEASAIIEDISATNNMSLYLKSQNKSASLRLTSVSASTTPYQWLIRTNHGDGRLMFYDESTGGAGGVLNLTRTGNVGIGTTGPQSLLHIAKSITGQLTALTLHNLHGSGSASGDTVDIGFSITTTDGSVNSARIGAVRTNRAVSGDTDLTFSTYSNSTLSERVRIKDSGNVGIGTTSPTQKLHVEGQCITGDSLLSTVPSDYNPAQEVQGSEFRVEKIQIKDIKPGTEVYSLNERTGKIEPARVNKLLDMGIKPVFKLITEGGREIRTTGNHPYLVQLPYDELQRRIQLQETGSLERNYGFSQGSLSVAYEFSEARTIWVDGSTTQSGNVNSSQYRGRIGTLSQDGVSPVSLSGQRQSLRGGGLSGSSLRTGIFDETTDQQSFASHPQNQSHAFRFNQLPQERNWVKVIYLQKGDLIAVPSLNSDLLNSEQVLWQKIKSIEYIEEEQVYDIEVENTHNFIANDIFAHNTYLSGSVGIGTTVPTYKLNVNSASDDVLKLTTTRNIAAAFPLYIVHNKGIANVVNEDAIKIMFQSDSSSTANAIHSAIGQVSEDVTSASGAGLAFYTGGYSSVEEKVRISKTGNVGIGTTGPNAKLEVTGDVIIDLSD